ncbi:flagellar filament capping protein FliD [Modestobacter sp. URMC 112]
MSLGTGLSSGIDYSTMISQLMQLEARPQTLLRNQLLGTKDDAAAYREINTAFAALSSAAQAVTGDGITAARKASSSSTTVTASAGPTAVPGSSLTFSVTALATGQTSMSGGTWSSATGDVRTAAAADSGSPLPGWPLTVVRDGVPIGEIDLPPVATLHDAAAAINASGHGLSATVVQLDGGHFKLRVASTAVGEAAAFRLTSEADPTGAAFTDSQAAGNATLALGGGVVATSASNTFADLLTGVSVTVSEVADGTKPRTTISVANDTAAVTSKVKAMIDAANSVLNTISKHTDNREGSDATLKGNSTLTSLSSQLLREISSAVSGRSPATVGVQLKRDGTIVFDAAKFTSTLTATPALAQQIAGGRTGVGVDNVEHTTDDTIDVDGLAARLSVLAERASDSAGGMITNLANSQDTRVKELQKQIDGWDVRLALRRTTLTAQFNALESTLGKLQNQASWLSGQLGSLPSSYNA